MTRSIALVFPLLLALSSSTWAICMEGQTKSCLVNGKRGTMTCEAGRWSPCSTGLRNSGEFGQSQMTAEPASREASTAVPKANAAKATAAAQG